MNGGLDWKRVAEGLTLLGIGCFLLATTLGYLPWSFWLDALNLWPVLIIGLGLRLIFERSRAPWAVLLSPLLVLGALGWVARGAHVEAPVGAWLSRSAERPKSAEGYTLAAHLSRARLDLEARPMRDDLLVDGRSGSEHDRGLFEVRGDSQNPKVRISSGRWNGWSIGADLQQRWELGLTAALPLRLELSGAANRAHADLTQGRLSEARIDGAFNDVELRLPRPDGPVRLHAHGAFNSLKLVVPKDTPVTVHTDGPFNDVDGAATRGSRAGDGPGYELRLNGAFNRVSVDQS